MKKYKIKVKNNPNYCGIGAGSIQFAYGESIVNEGNLVNWYKEHDGYEVEEVAVEEKVDG